MTATSLRNLTLATIENYRHAAALATIAYRQGGHRVVGLVNEALEKNVDPRTAQIAPQLVEPMIKLRGRVSEIVVKGIDVVSSRTGQALEFGYDGITRQVTKAAKLVGRIDNPTIANGLQTAARVSLPTAKVALAVSGKVADGAKALSTAAKGKNPVKVATRKVAAKTRSTAARGKAQAAGVQRKAVKAAKSARATAGRQVKSVKKVAVRAKRRVA
jgi:hypothetical protein